MDIGAVTSHAVQHQAAPAEARRAVAAPERDKEAGASKVEPQPPPVINASGQLVGQVINTTA